MRDYKQRADRILKRRDMVLAKRHRRKKALYKYTVPAAALCSVVTVCIGAALWNSSVTTHPSDMISYIQSSRSADSEAVTQTVTSAPDKTAEATTVTSVSLTDRAETQPKETDTAEYSYDTSCQQPAVTEAPVVTTEAPTQTVIQPTEVTKAVTEPTEEPTIEIQKSMHRLAASDDPIWVYSQINYGGMDYVGCRYINKKSMDRFYIAWTENSELTTYDTRKGHEVTEPVTIYGLSSKDEIQDNIITCFSNYEIYALYEAKIERSNEPYVPEYEDEDEDIGEEQTAVENEPPKEQPIDNE